MEPSLFTRESVSNCPDYLRGFWQGEVFYHNKNYGIWDALTLAQRFNFPLKNIENYFAGDFCLIVHPRKMYRF